jgi:RNase adapter protein RapZ
MEETERRLIIVSGLSGAGKTVVLNSLEDLSFYTIDNLPISLLSELISQFSKDDTDLPGLIAIGIDARNKKKYLDQLPEKIKSFLNKRVKIELIYIDANDEILTKRFSETRRKHPLSSDQMSLLDAIHKEREITLEISQVSDLHIDTSFMQLKELRDIVCERIARRKKSILSLQLISFGYKNGIPKDSDFIFDLRCLPNPYWEKFLREYSGKDEPVIEFLLKQKSVTQMLSDLEIFLERWLPRFEMDNRSYLTIGFGCTGGHHRSVFIVEQLAKKFVREQRQVIIRHRDL